MLLKFTTSQASIGLLGFESFICWDYGMDWINYLFVSPYSMLFIFLVNILVVIVGSSIFRLVVDVNYLEAREFEVRSYDRNLKEAKQRNDKMVLRRLKREETRIKRLSASASRRRLKAAMITVIPFTLVSILLNILYSGKGPIVSFPFEFSFLRNDFSFSIWYFLTYLTAYLPLSRLLHSSISLWGD